MFGKGMPYQGGLSGLAWTRNDKHRIAAGKALKPGFRVSGDIGHGWILLAFHVYIMAING